MKTILLLCFCFLFFLAANAFAEIFKYVDKKGSTVFVNDKSKIPEEFQDQLTSYAERFDPLSPSEKAALIRKEREEQAQRAEEEKIRQAQMNIEEKKQSEEQISDLPGKEAFHSQPGDKIQNVTIVGNQVLVPVTLNYHGMQIRGQFLLDTGASTTLVYRELLQPFGVNWAQAMKSTGTVAGGKKILSDLFELDALQVGPCLKTGIKVYVTDHEGPASQYQGLLGMDFLREHPYQINMEAGQIEWKN